MGVYALNNLEKVSTTTRATENPLSPVVNVIYFNVKVDPRLGYVTPATGYLNAVKMVRLTPTALTLPLTKATTTPTC